MQHIHNQNDNVLKAIAAHIPKVVAEADGWPDDAKYKVKYRTKCWPCDFDDFTIVYFNTTEQLIAWKRSYTDWSRLEGNSIEYDIWEWDLGPNLRSPNHCY